MTCPAPHQSPTRPRHRRGFTLIELLVVISILTILMTLAVGSGFALKNYGKQRETESTLANLTAMITEYEMERKRYPAVITSGEQGTHDMLIEMSGFGDIGILEDSGGVIDASGMMAAISDNIRIDSGQFQVVDGWDVPIRYEPSNTADADLAKQTRGRFYSAGPDQSFAGDVNNDGKPDEADNIYGTGGAQ